MADVSKGLSALIRRLQADGDDEAAQRELYERYRARLVGFCRTRLDDPNDAEDCTQDVFQDVFSGIGELREPQAFEAWMFRIARRKIGGYNTKPTPAALPSTADDDVPDLPDPVTDVEHDVRMRELLGTISDAVDSLPAPLDEVIKAYISAGGLRGSELAPRFGWDAKKADHELNRARTGLFAALETLVVVRTGRGACTQLNEVCARHRVRPGRLARLNQNQRRNVHRHITQCEICAPQARAARDRGQWALGPGIAQLADYMRRRRVARRLVAAAFVVIAMVSLPSTSNLVSPGDSNKTPIAIATPIPTRPVPTPTVPGSGQPTSSPSPTRSPTVGPPASPVGGSPTPAPPPTPTSSSRPSPPRRTPPETPPETPPPSRRPPPETPPPSRTPAPPRTAACTTTISLNPLTVRVNAVLLCVSLSLGD
jgi:RNA polymerase sigma factor (sigma-70 family)